MIAIILICLETIMRCWVGEGNDPEVSFSGKQILSESPFAAQKVCFIEI